MGVIVHDFGGDSQPEPPPTPTRWDWLAGVFFAVLLALLFLLAPLVAQAEAQFAPVHIDKRAIGITDDGVPWPYELDGERTTREFLILRVQGESNQIEYQPASWRQGRLCRGPWIDPWAHLALTEVTIGGLMEVGGVTVFVAQGPTQYQELAFLPFLPAVCR